MQAINAIRIILSYHYCGVLFLIIGGKRHLCIHLHKVLGVVVLEHFGGPRQQREVKSVSVTEFHCPQPCLSCQMYDAHPNPCTYILQTAS